MRRLLAVAFACIIASGSGVARGAAPNTSAGSVDYSVTPELQNGRLADLKVDIALAAGWPFWTALLFSALVVSIVAHTVYVTLLQRYEANLISALILVTPLATIALGVAVLHDPFGPRLVIGSVLALAGVLIIALRGSQVMSLLLAMRNRTL